MGNDAVDYEKERPRQQGSNRDEIVVLVVLLFWRGDIAGRCARFAPSEENETNVALIRSLYAHDTSLPLRPKRLLQSFGSGLFGPEQFQGARVRLAVVELLQGLRE